MTHHITRSILNKTPLPLPIIAALMTILFAALPALAQSGNLALGRSVTRSSDVSSGRAPNAVDGNVATFWQPLMSDRQDDSMVWLGVDLGGATPFNEIVLNFRANVANVNGFRLLTSNDNATWQLAFAKFRPEQTFVSIDRSSFPDVTARFVRVEIVLGNPTANFQLNELELYSSTPSLSRVFFIAADGRSLAPAETITLSAGASVPLTLRGRLTNGQDVTLENATVTMSSNKPAIASVTSTGADAAIATLQQGVALITAAASLDGVSRDVTLWIDSFDPAVVVADLSLAHASMEIAIGRPAVIPVGSAYPSLKAHAYVPLTLSGKLTRSAHSDVDGVDGAAALEIPTINLLPGVPTEIALPGTADQPGLYRLTVSLQRSGRPVVYDAFTFSALDSAQTPPGQSRIVFAGPDNRLGYAPDFKGNRPLDFSNAGYGGGGVALPNVQARAAVEPGEGDDSARIQAAIDQVSAMPQNAEGIRGAVLLKRGRFEVGTTLVIRASGVVLRGEGRGEDGTILFAIQDRGWLGSGHGWAGANYVAWNTKGDLVAQQPPTAQNYAIGHVGRKVGGFAPNSQDPRPRQDGWWESLGQNVEPRSLYLRQLTDRLGADAAQRIERTTVGGGALDTPRVESDLPLTKGIKIDNHALAGFSPTVFEYTVTLPAGTTRVPEARPHDSRHRYQTLPASHVNGKTVLILWDKHDASKSVRYTIRFVTPTL